MKLKNGDKIKFGIVFCNKMGRKELLNKTIMLTPQEFEYDNGLYTEDQSCPGIYNSIEEEPESIYHLFGNHFEWFYDCVLIPATPEDLKVIEGICAEKREAKNQELEYMIKYFEEANKVS